MKARSTTSRAVRRAIAVPPGEPDFGQACTWWADLPDYWTPLGWRNHLLRFNVFWNGCLLAKPDNNRRSTAYEGQGLQLLIVPLPITGEDFPFTRHPFCFQHDDHLFRQGWHDGPAPHLWTRVPMDGFVLQEDLFAHVPGGGDIARGDEPLFAWLRLSIKEACPGLPQDKRYGFMLHLYAPYVSTNMTARNNLAYDPDVEHQCYPRRLRPDTPRYDRRRGLRLLEPRGRVRLALPPGQGCDFIFTPPTKRRPHDTLYVHVPATVGEHIDVLVPMVPTARAVVDRELALGRDGALREANRYWARRPRTAATVRTPEPAIDAVIHRSVQFTEVLGERNPADGLYAVVIGSLAYADLWATPGAMGISMVLDNLGYHPQAQRYLETFRARQGTVTPPSDCFSQPHPGYLSSPKTLTSIDWISDHGALLWAIARHAMLSGDREFAARWAEPIVKACEFVRDARALRNHRGFQGIMPPAVATDSKTQIQGVWSDGWVYKGLTAAVRLLRQIGHPRAGEFGAVARDYRAAFIQALEVKTQTMPTWRDARGRRQHLVPTALLGEDARETRHGFYLDAGPLFLVFSGLMDARHPLMRATLEWFRHGPATRFFRRESSCWQVPVLDHEMSSCEPGYSWNVFHSHQLGDRTHYLQGLYSLFAGAVSRQTQVSCETRGGQSGMAFGAALGIHLARLAVIDDELNERDLHLLRLMPAAWVRARGRGVDRTETLFERMPTAFGPVTLGVGLRRQGRELHVDFRPHFHSPPRRIVLHVPPLPSVPKTLNFNGRCIHIAGRKSVPIELDWADK